MEQPETLGIAVVSDVLGIDPAVMLKEPDWKVNAFRDACATHLVHRQRQAQERAKRNR